MRLQWRPSDIVDLEYFYQKSADTMGGEDNERLRREDRRHYLYVIEPFLQEHPRYREDPGGILRLWLEHRRSTFHRHHPEAFLPGERFQASYGLAAFLLAVLGAGLGLLSTFSLLLYEGRAPVNVSAYFGIFVLLQIFLTGTTLLLLLLKRQFRHLYRFSITYRMVGHGIAYWMGRLRQAGRSRLPADRKNRTLSLLGLVRGRHVLYGPVFYWSFFVLVQIFAGCFNIGVLAATLLKVIGSDIAFGWQSTIQFSAEAIYRAAALIALPWSWFVPEHLAHPSLSHIEGSRMILKDGIVQLSHSGLISWWPFLCLAVVFYGLLPRIVLLLAGLLAQNRALKNVPFHTPDGERILRMLTTPVIRSSGTAVDRSENGTPAFPPAGPADLIPDTTRAERPAGQGAWIVLVPRELAPACPEDRLKSAVLAFSGRPLSEKILFSAGPVESADWMKQLPDRIQDPDRSGVLVVQEAWQPPIRETILFLSRLREVIGKRTFIQIGLIGKPGPNTIFTRPREHDRTVWKQAIDGMGDPFTTVGVLGGE